ncbi:MAG TPA: helix-turn-helix transcriptional regulator, partial [Agitococcus sp.]|nr:helix-turn-helix transcriptional regulator [Agitococcus sp.]HNC04391.1 helix-turn-helix transcriptional regulator [Agitococcus sp.]
LLSPRERQMAEMVVNGQTNQDIADTMSVAPTTLSTYRTRIYEKLDVENDVQLTHLALRFGVFKKD